MYNCKEKQNTNNSGVPTGTIINFFGDTAPDGYLSCDGTQYLKSDYPLLASHLASLTTANLYVGSDNDHFKVPDLRGEFLRGTGTNSHVNQGNGANVGVHQDGTEIPSYRNLRGGANLIQFRDGGSSVKDVAFDKVDGIKQGTGYMNISASASGDNAGDTLAYIQIPRPTNTSVLYCIKY
jgi:microcystin-dependent protein